MIRAQLVQDQLQLSIIDSRIEYENRLSIINKEVNNITNNIDKFKETIDVDKLEEESSKLENIIRFAVLNYQHVKNTMQMYVKKIEKQLIK